VRVDGAHRVPRTGPLIVVSNHQSYLDPVLNGIAARDRQVGYLAKSELFSFGPFGRLIASFGAIPLKERSDMAAMRAAITELQAGRCIVIYPEGGRCAAGEIEAFQRGVALIVRRTRVPVIPMALDGAFKVWPPSSKLPRPLGRLSVLVGDPIEASELLADADDGIARLESEVRRLQSIIRQRDRRHG
jgi:1-acyl-sn-glycerol-3-phosphate acyltransferase